MLHEFLRANKFAPTLLRQGAEAFFYLKLLSSKKSINFKRKYLVIFDNLIYDIKKIKQR